MRGASGPWDTLCVYRGEVPRSPLALAALSTLAVPGLDVHAVQPCSAPDGFDAATAIDSEQRRWVVRAPATLAAGAALEAEVAFLAALEGYVDDGRLPFEVPRAAGFAPLPEGGRAVVYPDLPGHPLRVERIVPGPGLSASLGRSVGALHELPVSIVERAGLPVYSAQEYRERRLSEVDAAASTGRVPVGLLRRWERALEDVAMWRFSPTITHTALSAETFLVRSGQVSAISDFAEVQVGDPADDLAWLLVTAPHDAVDSILEAYQLRRTELTDAHLVDRALLASELALARWLLHGVRTKDDEIVEDAVGMLADLERASTEVGAFSVASGQSSGGTGTPGSVPTPRATSVHAQAQDEAIDRARASRSTGSTPVAREAGGGSSAGTGSGASAGAGHAPSAGSTSSSGASPSTAAAPSSGPASQADAGGDDTIGDDEIRLPDYGKVEPRPHQDVATAAFTAPVRVVGSDAVAAPSGPRTSGTPRAGETPSSDQTRRTDETPSSDQTPRADGMKTSGPGAVPPPPTEAVATVEPDHPRGDPDGSTSER